MLGVFLDTLVLCTSTAFIILLAGGSSSDQMEGIRLTQDAMSSHLGEGGTDFVAAAISLFAFTSVVANYAYGESNLHMFKLDNKIGRSLHYWLFRHDLLGRTGSPTSGMGHGRHGVSQ